MAVLRLRIEPVFLGPASVGTVTIVKTLREALHIGLAEAKELVDRAVFGGETVDIPVDNLEAAQALAALLNQTTPPPRVEAHVLPAQ